MKLVINRCFGGFGLSHAAVMRYAELSGFALYPWLDKITLDVYGKKAVIGNPELHHHYSRVPVDDLPWKNSWRELPEGAFWSDSDLRRDDPVLVRVVEEMGAGHREGASGPFANLKVVEIPDGIDYEIDEYDGQESVAEKHRTWQ